MKINKLTIKQEKFCQEYIKTGDKSAAYRSAYNTSKMKDTTINNMACQLFKNQYVTNRVNELQAKAAKIAEKKFNITTEEMLRHLNILRNASIDEYVEFVEVDKPIYVDREIVGTEKIQALQFKGFENLSDDQKMCIESFKINRYGEIELKLHGKEWTIEKINKHIGFYEKDNQQKTIEINNSINMSELSDKALEEIEKAYNQKK